MTADDVRSVRAGGALVNSHRPTTSRDAAPCPGYRHYRGLGRDATVDLYQPRGSLVLQIVRCGPPWTRTTYLRVRRFDPCALSGASRLGGRRFIKCQNMALSGAIDSSGARLTLVTWNGEGILGAPSAARAETRSRSWSQGPEFSSVTNACSSAMKSSTRPGRLTPERARRAQGFVRERHQARDAPGHLGGFVGSGSKRPKRTCASSQWWAVPTVTRTTFR